MIRTPAIILALTAGLLFGAPTQSLAQQPDISGTYRCEGLNPDGTKYRGAVEIVKNGDTYRLRWSISSEPASFGIGIMNGDVLAVSYFNSNMTGVVLYRVEKGARLVGEWTVLGAEGKAYPETLTKAGMQASNPTIPEGHGNALLLKP